MTITIILYVMMIFLLFFVGLDYLDPPPESGIAVNFGTSETGSGNIQPTQPVASAPKNTSTQSSQHKSEVNDKVITQDVEDAPVIKDKPKKEEKQETVKPKEEAKPKESKPDPKPSESTTNALDALINGPKNDGTAQGSEGNDDTAGDKGNPNGNPDAQSYYGTGMGLDGDGNYLLGGRKALNKEKFLQNCNEAGTVVVSIEVNRNGQVINATPGVRGTTNNSKCLLEPAKKAALATRFNSDSKAPSKQIGKIIYRFSLSD